MSRGLGPRQREVLFNLYQAGKTGLLRSEIRERTGSKDRSNTRRAVRTLEECGLIERENARFCITLRGGLIVYSLTTRNETDPLDELREINRRWDDFELALRSVRAEKQRRREEKMARHTEWIGFSQLALRQPGSTQRLILKCLWEYADPMCSGLPVTVVKSICGLEKSNGRRAIRGLFARGYLDETPTGERIRLSEALVRHYFDDYFIPAAPIVLEELDDDRAKTILLEHGEDVGEGLPDFI